MFMLIRRCGRRGIGRAGPGAADTPAFQDPGYGCGRPLEWIGPDMLNNIWLVPLFPLISSVLLMVTAWEHAAKSGGRPGCRPRWAFRAVVVLLAGMEYMQLQEPFGLTLWTWMQVGNFAPGVAFLHRQSDRGHDVCNYRCGFPLSTCIRPSSWRTTATTAGISPI